MVVIEVVAASGLLLLRSTLVVDDAIGVFKTSELVGRNENSVLPGIDTGITVIDDVAGFAAVADDVVLLSLFPPVGEIPIEEELDDCDALVELFPPSGDPVGVGLDPEDNGPEGVTVPEGAVEEPEDATDEPEGAMDEPEGATEEPEGAAGPVEGEAGEVATDDPLALDGA